MFNGRQICRADTANRLISEFGSTLVSGGSFLSSAFDGGGGGGVTAARVYSVVRLE